MPAIRKSLSVSLSRESIASLGTIQGTFSYISHTLVWIPPIRLPGEAVPRLEGGLRRLDTLQKASAVGRILLAGLLPLHQKDGNNPIIPRATSARTITSFRALLLALVASEEDRLHQDATQQCKEPSCTHVPLAGYSIPVISRHFGSADMLRFNVSVLMVRSSEQRRAIIRNVIQKLKMLEVEVD